MTQRIEADYLIETPLDPHQAAEAMAGEQRSGTFVKVPGETPELHARAAARLETLDVLETVPEPSLPGGATGPHYTRARVTLSWPLDTVGTDLTTLMATVAGNLFELKQFTGLRLLTREAEEDFS